MAPDRGQNTDWIQANGGFRILRSWKRSGHRFITLYYPVCYLTISIMSNIGRNKNDFFVFLSNESCPSKRPHGSGGLRGFGNVRVAIIMQHKTSVFC